MRIIAGRHRGRSLLVPEDGHVRPTSDRIRESLFNILAHGRFNPNGSSPIADAVVLDAFAGTGALGFEALSRGAAHVVFLDNDLTALECLNRNAARLGEAERISVVQADATRPPDPLRVRGWPGPCTLALLDPPYRGDLAGPALAALAAAGWLAPTALVAVEAAAKAPFDVPDGFTVLDRRRYGGTALVFLRFAGGDKRAP